MVPLTLTPTNSQRLIELLMDSKPSETRERITEEIDFILNPGHHETERATIRRQRAGRWRIQVNWKVKIERKIPLPELPLQFTLSISNEGVTLHCTQASGDSEVMLLIVKHLTALTFLLVRVEEMLR